MNALVSAQNPADMPAAPDAYRPMLDAIDALWSRGIKTPVEKLCDLGRLDLGEIQEGYIDGHRDAMEPGNNRSRAYWHGWRNAQHNSHRLEPDTAARELARRVYWWSNRSPPSGRVATKPHRYSDLERALERGEPV